ncbi:MAG: hypothetical protein U9Q83_02780 [Bacteroidota bacterium]|nr:hypothetical protein [Bacteroidota bacterium]
MENPFADYGSIVFGDRFIGRKEEIKAVQNRIFGKAYGNLAIQGLPRIGKSSLAWKAILEYNDEFEKKQLLTILVEVGEIKTTTEFFNTILKELNKTILKKGINEFEDLYSQISQSQSATEKRMLIKDYFEFIKDKGFRVIYILDEFDSVRNYFDVHDFQLLRALSYSPKTKICIVTVSRRMLSEIEEKGGGGSNFHQTFNDIYLGMYDDNDLSEYWEKFFNSRIPISDEGKQKIYEFAGRHPFLLDLFNYHLYNNLTENIIQSIDKTRENIKLTILNNYKTILDLLKEEKLDTKLLQIIVGPVYNITVTEAEKLERYNLVVKSKNKTIHLGKKTKGYDAFSHDFENFLIMKKREIPIWDLWSETETKLRQIVLKWLVGKFGKNWITKFRKLQNKEKVVASLEAMQMREKKSFPDTYSENLLDFTYPAELFNNFMQVEWSWFKEVFGKDMQHWKAKFDVLARIRNPLAHNKENILKGFEKNQAKAYCEEIISKIDTWHEEQEIKD